MTGNHIITEPEPFAILVVLTNRNQRVEFAEPPISKSLLIHVNYVTSSFIDHANGRIVSDLTRIASRYYLYYMS